MTVELRKLSIDNGMDIYNMLQEIPKDENGYINNCNGRTYEEYKQWLVRSDNISKGIGLEDWMVSQDTYWLYVNGVPVGEGKLRHRLTDKLKEEGGHIGYAIAPSYRNRGYGKILLKLMIDEAKMLGIDRILLTIQNHNKSSLQVALANGGVIEKVNDIRHYIWIDCNSQSYCANPIFEKSCGAVLFTESDQRYYVLVQSANDNIWGLPKGHVERGETEQETALREIFEETGIQAEILDGFREVIEYTTHKGAKKQVVFFIAKYENQDLLNQPSEINNIALKAIDEALKQITYDNTKNVLIKADKWLDIHY